VLGGGLVAGSVVLLAGPPGIGKSTLLLQAAALIRASGSKALYVSGEESAPQVRLRAERLGAGALEVDFLGATAVTEVIRACAAIEPDVLAVDSVHTLASPLSDAAPGTVSQIRECAAALQEYAKSTRTPVVMVGHVTKRDAVAGPRALEHLVDAVLHFEGSRGHEHRVLRAAKNRFGSVDEVAVFRMSAGGLVPVSHPSEVFLSGVGEVSGSAVAVTFQGSRPLLAEIQCLTAPSRYGTPQRTTSGLPARRLALLLTVLERRAGLPVLDRDVFANVVGGLRLLDPGTDLAVAASLVSAELDRPAGRRAFIGEIGLGGEIRPVPRLARRVAEAARLGLTEVLVPSSLERPTAPEESRLKGPTLRRVAHVRELVDALRA
jgi:DNA repair protein RadA/Sms